MGFIILLCLAGIAVGVYIKQFSFNPAVLAAATVAPEAATVASTPASGNAASILPASPPELAVMSAPDGTETSPPVAIFSKSVKVRTERGTATPEGA